MNDIKLNIKSPAIMLQEIEKIKAISDLSYIDAILEYCAKHNLESETVVPSLKKNKEVLEKIEREARDLNFLK